MVMGMERLQSAAAAAGFAMVSAEEADDRVSAPTDGPVRAALPAVQEPSADTSAIGAIGARVTSLIEAFRSR